MWILFAIASSIFAGLTAILSKIGIESVNSHLATAIRTTVVLFFSWLLVFISGHQTEITSITFYTLCFLILSGVSTGISWLFYFRAMQLGEVNKVSAIDKTSTILTILLAFFFLKEPISLKSLGGILFIAFGTWLMTGLRSLAELKSHNTTDYRWLFYGFGSAFFASLTAIFGKIGIENVNSQLGTAIRTIFVLICAWGLVFIQGKQKELKQISTKSWFYLLLSGIATGASWICYYRALQDGNASVVVPIDKLSILVTVIFSYFVLKETISNRTKLGVSFLLIGTLLLI